MASLPGPPPSRPLCRPSPRTPRCNTSEWRIPRREVLHPLLPTRHHPRAVAHVRLPLRPSARQMSERRFASNPDRPISSSSCDSICRPSSLCRFALEAIGFLSPSRRLEPRPKFFWFNTEIFRATAIKFRRRSLEAFTRAPGSGGHKTKTPFFQSLKN